jgi:hypothetical protein
VRQRRRVCAAVRARRQRYARASGEDGRERPPHLSRRGARALSPRDGARIFDVPRPLFRGPHLRVHHR